MRRVPAARIVAALRRAARRLMAVIGRARLAVAGCALLAGSAGSVAAFEGRVTLPDGAPAADATVAIVGQPGTSRTDADGRFIWQPDPTPPFMILVVLADGRVAPPVSFAALPAGEPLAVRIEPGLSESVIVAAGAAPHIEAPPAAARTLVAREDLAQRRPQRLTDILENLPNTGRLEEGASVVPSIRGLARGRTLLLIDGARVTAERRAGPSATYLDPEILESTEVTRGPGSVAFGSDAFGGVIDARTRSAPHDAPWSGRFDGTVGAGWPEAAGRIEVQRGFGAGGFLLSAHDRDLGDYDSPEGEVPDSAAEDRGFLLRGTHEVGAGLLGLGWQTDSGTDIGKPSQDAATTSSVYPRETSNRFTASWDIDPRGAFTEAGVEIFLGDYRLLLERDQVAGATTPRTVSSSNLTARDFGVRTGAGRTLGPGTLRFGVDINGRFDLHATGEVERLDPAGDLLTRTTETSIENAHRTDTGLFGIVEQPMGSRVTGSLGLRADRPRTATGPGTRRSRCACRAASA
jgi:outer membrane receptor protein involved in Fe transport